MYVSSETIHQELENSRVYNLVTSENYPKNLPIKPFNLKIFNDMTNKYK